MTMPAREMTALSQPPTTPAAVHDLAEAFARFSAASAKLEDKYELLRRETEQLRARLRQQDEEIKRSARLAMLGETAAALAHEVRNPLGALRLFLSLLRGDLEDRPASLEIVQNMDRTITSLNHVVENILQFAKGGSAVFSPVNVEALLREQATMIQDDPRAKISFDFRFEKSGFVLGNEHCLRHVFANLLGNAAQAMQWKGEIAIHTQLSSDGKMLRLIISDNGPGIRSDLLPRIFEPFVTGKREGTGLGLAVVKKILDQHSAQIAMGNKSAPEHGAVVELGFKTESPVSIATHGQKERV